MRGTKQAGGGTPAAPPGVGGRGAIERARVDHASGAGVRSDDRRHDVAERVGPDGIRLEAHAVQFKKKRDPERFARAEGEIADLIRQAEAGEIELAYVDEAGFAAQPPNRSGWTKRGETHAVEAKRTQRLNVIGALLSSGRLVLTKLWQTVTGLWFFGFLMALATRVEKPLVVILDNASIHTAKSLQPYWELLEENGLRCYFLPPYSPELNRIEILWRKIKYEWLPFRSYSPVELEQAIDRIGAGFGSQYKLTFC